MTEPQIEAAPKVPEHVHIWDILDVWLPKNVVYHPQLRQVEITTVLIRCRECNLPKTIELQGIWTLEQILKNHARIQHRKRNDELQ
jgi:hypothetical protein